MRILKRKFSGQFNYYNNIFNDFLLLIPITSLLYLITTIFNLSFLFYQQPFLLLLLPLYSINILALAKNTIFGFQ
ncbi:MAG: hypothetical protein J7K83_01990, partial [Candidatus Aenigmarchaeota archaeon]|nr:hypothetical protein [Candidatus Aenigmarchaeota archaeon]